MKGSSSRRAFGFIELVMVAAVVFGILSLLVPLFSAKKDRAMGSQCMSNLKRIGVAMRVYGADWDGKFPWAYEWNNPGQRNIYDCLMPYVSDPSVFQCPADRGEITQPGWSLNGKTFWQTFDTSYNYPGVNYMSAWPFLAGLPQTNPTIPKPPANQKWVWDLPLSKRIMVFDGRPWHRSTNEPAGSWSSDYPGLCNIVFCDGHVGSMENKMLLRYLGIMDGGEPK